MEVRLASLPAIAQDVQGGGSLLDAIEKGINVAEADPSVDSVGLGGAPNAAGVVQLDACFMDGATQKAGSVAALENYTHPISVARARHGEDQTRDVGWGWSRRVRQRAGVQDCGTVDGRTEEEVERVQAAQKPAGRPPNHDTIALVGVNSDGHLAGGCSTSGLAYKMPGRVGDSPILGSGLYVDGEIGAAGATGIGENVMRFCGSFLIVEFMRSGMDPTAACRAAIERIARMDRKPASELHINFLAIDKAGRFGAAGTDAEYRVAVVTPSRAELIEPELVQ